MKWWKDKHRWKVAAITTGIEEGGAFQQALGLGTGDVKIIIANLIRIFLGLLGVIAVGLIVYGGFLWMTSAGNEERVHKAKQVLINAVVGLTIVLMSYVIVAFVLGKLLGATLVGTDVGDGSSSGSSVPVSTSSVFVVEAVSPQGTQSIKNLTVRLTFNRDVDEATVDNITVKPTAGGEAVSGTYSVNGDRVKFKPSALCQGYDDEYCFDADTGYTISLGSGLLSTDGKTISCGGLYDACEYTFTSGSLVDTTDPVVDFTYPEDGDSISVNALVPLQASVTDDAGVSLVEFYLDGTLIDTVQPEGETTTSYSAEIDWDTSALVELERYNLYAIGYDVNDHDAKSDSVLVTARAEHCFNGATDEDETGEDCGGEDCGACGGEACDSNDDCQSGVCTDGVCIDVPEITGISPESGAGGTYVTISGNNFGSSRGTVLFGTTEVDFASCDDVWSNDQVIVVVPESFSALEEYTITLLTGDGYSDTTQDDNGTLIDDFVVNEVERPGLCAVSPDSGIVGDIVTFRGVNFGTSQASSAVYFEESPADAYSEWADTRFKATVPTLAATDYQAVVYVGGVASNAVDFTVEDEDKGAQPTIGLVDPDSGAKGQYITISGSAFGSSVGLVYFTNNDSQSADYGAATVADVDFPAVCADSYWSRDQVIVKVPEISPTSYLISLTRQDETTSNSVDFTVTSGTAGPGVCAVEPSAGPPGYAGVVLSGEGFGLSDGLVTFFENQLATITSWDAEEVIVTVPEEATTGALTLADEDGTEANDTNFEVGDCNEEDLCDANTQQCCSSGACVSITSSCPEDDGVEAEYVWVFSTGDIPTVPELQIGCSDDLISPTPWSGRDGGDEVCVNAGISGTFDLAMDRDSFVLNESVLLFECTGTDQENPCASTSSVALDDLETTKVSFTAFPASSLAPATTYQVTLTDEITSSSGTSIATTTWTFVTSTDGSDCEVRGVQVTPSSETIDEADETAIFNAQALDADACVILNDADIDWTWSTDGTYAALTSDSTCEGAPSSCQMAIGLQEGDSYMLAEESTQGFDDDADLLINFTDPYAVDYWPNCSGSGTACINAAIGAEFNTIMDEESMERLGNVTVYSCTDESCATYVSDMTGVVDLLDDDPTFVDINISADLQPTTYYEVVISGEVLSASGVPLSDYYGGDLSWRFLTRADSEPCAIDTVVMRPSSATLTYVGATSAFSALPYSDADDCSVAGQQLDAAEYSWEWGVENKTIATLWSDGLIIVSSDQVPDGCTAACVPEGTQSYTAICGDDADGDGSDLDPGEDCDDGDATSGDGCSSTCLNEGTAGTGLCGNDTLDSGEECDDGNTVSRDGCSSGCLNEGSAGGQTTCGDGVVTHLDTRNSGTTVSTWAGGEDCDYASSNPDESIGCTRACVHEGSVAVSGIVGVCGDTQVDDPAEQCDDGGTTALDGCSATCLFEGSQACTATLTSGCCGNGTTESSAYESCDDGNTTNNDGCSAVCLLEGSDASRATPSWCGDAISDDSEYALCEIDSSALDSYIESEQVTIIASTAPGEVEDGLATTQVEAATGGVTGEATLSLSCSCEDDLSCGEDTVATIGCGTGGCCYERPQVTSYTPTGEACRNTLLSLTFDQAMVSGSLADNVVVTMELIDSEECPYDSLAARIPASEGFFGRLLSGLRRTFSEIIHPVLAQNASIDCVLPVTFVSETVEGGERVSLIYEDLLEADHDYTITVTGDAGYIGEGVRSQNGVTMAEDYTFVAKIGDDICSFDTVRISDTDTSAGLFTATNEEHIFLAEAVTIQGGVEEAIVPISGSYDWQWSDGWWSTDEEIVVLDASGTDEVSGSNNTVTAAGSNGEATVYVSATIVTDTLFEPSTEEEVVYGSSDVTANLCENPWPALPSAAELAVGESWGAFEDSSEADTDPDDDGTAEIAEQIAYMNFRTYYCRDAGVSGTSDDYDAADAVAVADPPSDVLKEYLFTFGNGDGIGIRVAENGDLLSLADWYADQGFTGSPSATTVDGYEALTDGRTTYVSAANVNGAGGAGIIYGNIYAISYSENADEDTVAIFNQMLENWSFNTNLDNDQLCYESDGTPSTDNDGQTIDCTADLDCSSQDCRADKDKVTRDLDRLTDFGQLQADLEVYGEANGRCSATTDTSCTSDDDCDGDETCEPLYPTVSSGSFLRSMTTSAWDSWQSVLGNELDVAALEVDPLNDYVQCGQSGGTYESYNADTCWYEAPALYVCPEGSHVYTYRNYGGTSYALSTDLEYDYVTGTTEWSAELDADYTDGLDVLAGLAFLDTSSGYQEDPTCDGAAYGSSSVCGDGVIGASESCEIGETSTAKCTVETCISTDADYDGLSCADVDCTNTALCQSTDTTSDGTRIVPCNETCTGYETTSDAACVPYRCGNGVVDDGETCDDGSHNGDYGYCGSACDWDSAFYCGDGTLAGGEACDEGAKNGVYAASSADSCNATCSGLGTYCGDSIVNGSESCDGAEQWDGALCYGGTDDGEVCESDSDCSSGICGAAYSCELASEVSCSGLNDTTSCGSWGTCTAKTLGTGSGVSPTYTCKVSNTVYCDGLSDSASCQSYNSALACTSVDSESYDACEEGTVCLDYDDAGAECTSDTNCDSGDCLSGFCTSSADVGAACDDDDDCAGDSDCSTVVYQLSRTRACTDSCAVDGAWSDCLQSDDYCGNGSVDGSEECDDGNTSNNDACTNNCTENICGDGYLYSGEETCDEGEDNGVVCSGNYGKTCRYCSDACVYLTATGAYCGDGEVDDSEEVCDPATGGYNYYCYDATNGYIAETCDPTSSAPCADEDYTCERVGICVNAPEGFFEAGFFDDYYCDLDSANESGFGGPDSCGGFTSACEQFVCSEDCSETCPPSYESSIVTIAGNGTDQSAQTTLELYSEENSSTPNAATISVPACTAFSTLTGDVDGSNVEAAAVNIMFIIDQTPSMASRLDAGIAGTTTRFDWQLEMIGSAADDLAEAYVEAGVSFSFGLGWFGGYHGDDDDGDGIYSEDELDNFVVDFDSGRYFTDNGIEFYSVALGTVPTLLGGPSTVVGAPLYEALNDAIDAFANDPSVSSTDRNYIVLFTDGKIQNLKAELNRLAGVYGLTDDDKFGANKGLFDEYAALISTKIDEAKEAGIEVFNITAFYSSACDARQAGRWSSLTAIPLDFLCNGIYDQGDYIAPVVDIDYAPDHETDAYGPYADAAPMSFDYDEVVESILDSTTGITITITDSDGNEGITTLTDFADGVELTMPSGFACDETYAQSLSLTAAFPGSGAITIDNLAIDSCLP